MTRPRKNVVDYFPHSCTHGKTIFILEDRFKNDGYAFWFKLLELLGSSEDHVIDAGNPATWEFLLSKTRVSEETGAEILDLLAKLEAIDPELWADRIIWSSNFVSNLHDVYRKRASEIPKRPDIRRRKPDDIRISDVENPQSKVKETKVNKSKELKTLVEQARPDVSDIMAIFEFWQSELNHPQSRLDKKRLAAIKARLSEGYSVDRIKQAIRGIKNCPHNMGQNDRNQRYDDIELICRTGANVDRFADAEAGSGRFAGQERYENALLTKGGSHETF